MNDEHEAVVTRLLDAFDASETVRELVRAFVYRAVEAELQSGQSVESVVASAVYAAFRRAGTPRSLEEIAAVAELDRTAIGRSYKHLTRELDIDLAPVDPREFVTRFATSLDVNDETELTAHDIVDKTVEAELHSGVAPAGVAAAALYLANRLDYEDTQSSRASHDRLFQQDIAAAAGVSVVTLRNRYAEQATLVGFDSRGSIPSERQELFNDD